MKRLFKNATIIDGSGAPAFQGYVITEKDKIEAVSCGKAPEGFDGEAYDCMGLTVAPGFIDAHSHNDWFAARQNPLPFFIPFAYAICLQHIQNLRCVFRRHIIKR